jgi:Asp-tRNA(Asn)/Glu-tRNA(Gln) amidotransferase A subunit family amidase
VGRAWDEATVLRVGRALELAADFRTLPYGLEAAA